MMNVLGTGHFNPQAALGRGSQMNPVNTGAAEESEKKQRTLEEEKKAIQNSLLLMKTTSGDSVGSEESIEFLERKLEEIENRIKTGEKETSKVPANNFDVYCKGSGKEWTD